MAKKMCKEDKKATSRKEKDAKFHCKSCGAEANKEKHLCKPKKND